MTFDLRSAGVRQTCRYEIQTPFAPKRGRRLSVRDVQEKSDFTERFLTPEFRFSSESIR